MGARVTISLVDQSNVIRFLEIIANVAAHVRQKEIFSLDRFVFSRLISKINFINLIYAREYYEVLLKSLNELSKILRSSASSIDLKSADFFLLQMDNYFYMAKIKIKFIIFHKAMQFYIFLILYLRIHFKFPIL